MRIKINIVLISCLVWFTHSKILAKGLDNLEPEAPAPKQETKAAPEENKKAPEATPPVAPANAPAATPVPAAQKPETKEPEPAKEEDKTVEEEQPVKAEETKEPPPQSALSKTLENNLFLSTCINKVFMTSSEKGDWGSGGASDFAVGYRLPKQSSLIPTTLPPELQFFGTFRYAPMDVTVKAAKKSYRGVVQGYNFGLLGQYEIMKDFYASGNAEIGYMVVHVRALDAFKKENSLESGGLHLTLGGGCAWKFLEKLEIGPRLNLTIGNIKNIQLGAVVALFF